MRSYYEYSIQDQYGSFPEPFRATALELALNLLDIPKKSLRVWLRLSMEQQDINVNLWVSARRGVVSEKAKRPKAALYVRPHNTRLKAREGPVVTYVPCEQDPDSTEVINTGNHTGEGCGDRLDRFCAVRPCCCSNAAANKSTQPGPSN